MVYSINIITNEKGILFTDIKGKVHKEKFITIENTKGYSSYLLSNTGKIYSFYLKRQMNTPKNSKGYKKIYFYNPDKNDSRDVKYLHRLVAEKFLEKTKRDIELKRNTLHFIDWNRKNVTYCNLMWLNNKEMMALRNFHMKLNKTKSIYDKEIHKYLDYFLTSENRYTMKEIIKIFYYDFEYNMIEDLEEIKSFLKKRRKELKNK